MTISYFFSGEKIKLTSKFWDHEKYDGLLSGSLTVLGMMQKNGENSPLYFPQNQTILSLVQGLWATGGT